MALPGNTSTRDFVDRERHREAVTTRPELLGGVARQTLHAGMLRENQSCEKTGAACSLILEPYGYPPSSQKPEFPPISFSLSISGAH
jgi:hypothetical protein